MKKLLCALLVLGMICGSLSLNPDTAIIQEAYAAKVKMSKTLLTLTKGKSSKLSIKGTKKKAKWSSSNKKIATVSSKGKVSAKKAGSCTVTAKVKGKKYRCRVIVEVPSISAQSLNMIIGSTASLSVNGTSRGVNWSSSDSSVVSVSGGSLTALALGHATIYASVGGNTYSCQVNVSVKTYGTLVYSDDKVDVRYYKTDLSNGYYSMYFNVSNKTDTNMIIQSESLGINGLAYSNVVMSDTVGAHSTVTIDGMLMDASSSTIDLKNIQSVSGTLNILDNNLNSIETVSFTNKNVDDGSTSSVTASLSGYTLLASNSYISIYFYKSYVSDNEANIQLLIANNTSTSYLIQSDGVGVNGVNTSNAIMSDYAQANTVTLCELSTYDSGVVSAASANATQVYGVLNIINPRTLNTIGCLDFNKSVN